MAGDEVNFDGISAVTVFTVDMAVAVSFYRALGFELRYGGEAAPFTSFHVGSGFLNLMRGDPPGRLWGRTIIHVSDVDAMYRRAVDAGLSPEAAPADAPWGERYFHIQDPDGNELSFARPL
ncbi:VOC family protein [Ectothiorhodospiraceae bacterium WFHF3C12]|nr:VOC family protein [Ectothiorhodospiraceae bacterium WFHF3C12]